jgi:hypothetical protein
MDNDLAAYGSLLHRVDHKIADPSIMHRQNIIDAGMIDNPV